MATTPNYGWVTPAPTDLVTDLPADFETFADAVDADLAGLLGGTTGQVLKKTSNSDHAFAFGVDPTFDLVTTAGDLVYGTAADTLVRLGIGTANQVLTVNSGATAPEWATPAAAGGKLLQVTSAVLVSSVTNSSTAAFTSVLTTAITPAAATSKVLFSFNIPYLEIIKGTASIRGAYFEFYRGATLLKQTEINSIYDTDGGAPFTYFLYDSPNTTSSTTYEVKFRIRNTGSGTSCTASADTLIVLQEIGA